MRKKHWPCPRCNARHPRPRFPLVCVVCGFSFDGPDDAGRRGLGTFAARVLAKLHVPKCGGCSERELWLNWLGGVLWPFKRARAGKRPCPERFPAIVCPVCDLPECVRYDAHGRPRRCGQCGETIDCDNPRELPPNMAGDCAHLGAPTGERVDGAPAPVWVRRCELLGEPALPARNDGPTSASLKCWECPHHAALLRPPVEGATDGT